MIEFYLVLTSAISQNFTFTDVWETSDMEWKYSKSFYQVTHRLLVIILDPTGFL